MAFVIPQLHPRAALRAGVGLRVEASVSGIVILSFAGRAHLKLGHRRELAVVGDVPNDGVARTAVGAVGEWVAVTPVRRVAEVCPTIGARGDVGRDQHELPRLFSKRRMALANLEAGESRGFQNVLAD